MNKRYLVVGLIFLVVSIIMFIGSSILFVPNLNSSGSYYRILRNLSISKGSPFIFNALVQSPSIAIVRGIASKPINFVLVNTSYIKYNISYAIKNAFYIRNNTANFSFANFNSTNISKLYENFSIILINKNNISSTVNLTVFILPYSAISSFISTSFGPLMAIAIISIILFIAGIALIIIGLIKKDKLAYQKKKENEEKEIYEMYKEIDNKKERKNKSKKGKNI